MNDIFRDLLNVCVIVWLDDVHCKGYPAEDDKWEPKENLSETALRARERQSQENGRTRDRQFRKFIGDYLRKSRAEAAEEEPVGFSETYGIAAC